MLSLSQNQTDSDVDENFNKITTDDFCEDDEYQEEENEIETFIIKSLTIVLLLVLFVNWFLQNFSMIKNKQKFQKNDLNINFIALDDFNTDIFYNKHEEQSLSYCQPLEYSVYQYIFNLLVEFSHLINKLRETPITIKTLSFKEFLLEDTHKDSVSLLLFPGAEETLELNSTKLLKNLKLKDLNDLNYLNNFKNLQIFFINSYEKNLNELLLFLLRGNEKRKNNSTIQNLLSNTKDKIKETQIKENGININSINCNLQVIQKYLQKRIPNTKVEKIE